MSEKYYKLFNRMTEGMNDYIVIEETNEIYTTMLPVAYYWLKFLGKESDFHKFATQSEKMIFSFISEFNNDEMRVKTYNDKYGEFYKGFCLNDDNYLYLNDLSSFLEHYQYYAEDNTISEAEKIERSLVSHRLQEKEFKKCIGELLLFVTKNNQRLKKEERVKVLTSNKLAPFAKMLYFS